jgi:hypothetical protein
MLCHYSEFRVLFIVVLNVIMLTVVILNVVMLSVMGPSYLHGMPRYKSLTALTPRLNLLAIFMVR